MATECIHLLFASGHSALYLDTVVCSLSMPPGALLRFRYRPFWLSSKVTDTHPEKHKGSKALIVYTNQQYSPDSPSYIPCRFGEIHSVNESGDFWCVTVRLDNFAKFQNVDHFTQCIKEYGDNVPKTKGHGKYWSMITSSVVQDSIVAPSSDLKYWNRTITLLNQEKDFNRNVYNFFTIANIRRHDSHSALDTFNMRTGQFFSCIRRLFVGGSGVDNGLLRTMPTVDQDGVYRFPSGSRCSLDVHFDSCRPLVAENRFEVSSTAGIDFVTSNQHAINNEYDFKTVYFVVNPVSFSKSGMMRFSTLRYMSHDSHQRLCGVEFVVEYTVAASAARSVITIACMTLGLFLASYSDVPIYFKLLGSLLAASTAFFGLPKVK